jgi:hypothetical protein
MSLVPIKMSGALKGTTENEMLGTRRRVGRPRVMAPLLEDGVAWEERSLRWSVRDVCRGGVGCVGRLLWLLLWLLLLLFL